MTKKVEKKLDPEDGLPALVIGEWAQEKHRMLTHYIEASTPAREKAYPESAFVDFYCGPGRAFVKGRDSFDDGSPLLAARAAQNKGNPFSHFFINDENEESVKACSTRLSKIGTKHVTFVTGLKIGEKFKTITGPRNAPLYWLVIAARHDLADKIWSSIVSAGKQKNLF